jgi:hypothetical protein
MEVPIYESLERPPRGWDLILQSGPSPPSPLVPEVVQESNIHVLYISNLERI